MGYIADGSYQWSCSKMGSATVFSLIASGQVRQSKRCLALCGGGYTLIYMPTGHALEINLNKISGAKVTAAWFDPRTGESTAIVEFENAGWRTFDLPANADSASDWVLVLHSGNIKNPE